MPPKDQYNEILILAITGVIVFLVLAGLVVFILLFYQKKKFQHREKLTEMEKQFSEEMLRSQLELQEQTFNAISLEIHDNVGQMLSLAKVQMGILEQGEKIDRLVLQDAKDNISKAIADLRDIAHSMNTERIKVMDLPETIKGDLVRIESARLMKTSIHIQGFKREIYDQKKLIVARIVQESLQNIIKHSCATDIYVSFDYNIDYLKIDVTDNGKGFDVANINKGKTGIGLKNIVARAAMIGGKAVIDSSLNKGTSITITIPYDG